MADAVGPPALGDVSDPRAERDWLCLTEETVMLASSTIG
jgi:hypothetical protein